MGKVYLSYNYPFLSHDIAPRSEITPFVIYKVMEYRKNVLNVMHIFKKTVFHSRENISCISRVKLDVLCFLH